MPEAGDDRNRAEADRAGYGLVVEGHEAGSVAAAAHHQHDVGSDAVPRRGPPQGRDELRRGARALERSRDRGHCQDAGALPAGELGGDIGVARRTGGVDHRDPHHVGRARQSTLPVVEPFGLQARPHLLEGAQHQALAQLRRYARRCVPPMPHLT